MKVLMCEWVGGIKDLPSWFKHGEETDVSWDQIKELFDIGNNVMIKRHRATIMLAVDNLGFNQR